MVDILKLMLYGESDLCSKKLWYELNPRVRFAFGNVFFLSWLIFVFLDAAALVILAIGSCSSIGTSLSETIRRQLEPRATASFWMWLTRLAFGPHLGDVDLDLMKHLCFWGQSNLFLSCNVLLAHTCLESLIWYKAMIALRNTAGTFSGLASLYLIKDG